MIQTTMQAAVLSKPGKVKIARLPMPEARPGWVVIRVEAAGICGTDVAIYQGSHPANLPIVMGHEFSGRILAIGKGINGLRVDQRVMAQGSWALEIGIPDEAGHVEIERTSEMLGRTIGGCFAEAITVPAEIVHPIPAGVSFLSAQSVTTLATAIHARDRAGDISQKRVAIIGPGHAGLLLLQVCLLAGAAEVGILGTRDYRLAIALSLGAHNIVNVREQDFKNWLLEPEHQAFDVVFEASGTVEGLAQSISLVKDRGTVVVYGIIDGPLTDIPGNAFYSKELTITGSKGAGGRYKDAIQLIAENNVRVEPLVSHCLQLDEVESAFSLVLQRLDNVMRVVLTPTDLSLL